MSLDELARAATTSLRRSVSQDLDPDAMLIRLHLSRRRRTAARAVAAVIAVALTGTLAGWSIAGNTGSPAQPAVSNTPTARHCADPPVACLGDRRIRISLDVPITVTVPPAFELVPATLSRTVAEFYRTDVRQTGVTVMENAVPVRYDASFSRDPSAGVTARAMAYWLVDRPFLHGAKVTMARISGRPAWQVKTPLKPNASLPADKGLFLMVAPTFVAHGATSGLAPNLPGDFTLLDQPDGTVTVIWSWTHLGPPSYLTGSQALVAALRFG